MTDKLSIVVEGEKIVLQVPLLNRTMTPEEAYLAGCYAVWIAAMGGNDKAFDLMVNVVQLARKIVEGEDGATN